ncbi:hypothetical protein [Helicobacter mesocricetorum]|uniref:hypothetical protein n=1 Tax=Helicobacter mesocricetorum TaxID=87012 RepID=UPI000CF08630|nr:hypothetical protein [Helicobacter mesocricetorum]
MKFFGVCVNLVCAVVFLSGCLYRNKCGYSNSYWEEKGYYYDAQGNYREICPPDNIIYRDDAPRGNDSLMDFDAPIY